MTTSEGTSRVISLSQPPGVYSDKYFRSYNLRLEQLLREVFGANADLRERILILEAGGGGGAGGSYFGRRYFGLRYFG